MITSSSRRARTPVPAGRSGGRRSRLRAAGVCLGVVAAIGLAVPPASASHYQASLEGSAFQIEDNANFTVETDTQPQGDPGPLATLDWNNVDEARQGDEPTGSSDDSYSGGVKEDTLCPTTTTGSIPNNKSDLKTFGIYVEPGSVPGDPGFLHLFWTRVSDPSGTTLMDFEFNQSTEVCAAGRVNKVRTIDDLLIEYSIVQGGARAVITVRKWSGTQWGPATTFSANEATGTTNTSQIAFGDTGGVSDVNLNARTFGEASIDLDALFDDTKCTSFGSAMLKSRSSDSFTSQLKDFIKPLPINLTNCAQVTIRKQTTPDGETQLFDFAKTFDTDPASEWTDSFQLADDGVKSSGKVLLGNDLTVSEGDLPAGWEFDSVNCSASTDVVLTIEGRTVTFSLDATTDKLDCTFNNSRLRGSIQVEKVVTATEDRIDGASFALDEDGDPETTGDQTSIPEVSGEDGLFCVDDLLLGTYNVLETAAPDGFSSAGPAQSVDVTEASTCADREAGDVDATFENTAEPTIVTQASGPVTVGEDITDTATLSGGYNPTGTITFTAYSDATCETQVFTDDVTVDSGNGDYTSDPWTTVATGTIYWIAAYSGDASNAPASGQCGDANESSAVGNDSPTIVTQASGPVTVGAGITDTATLSGGFNPTGTITFTAYSDDECSTEVFSDDVPVSGNGDYTSDAYTTVAAGTIYWIASYSGDSNNGPASGSCGDANESSVVNPQTPTITTDAQDTVVVGGTITDTATLSGGYNPTGTITFTAYSDDSCETVVFSDLVNVDSGNASYTSGSYTTEGTGTIYWIAAYSGDANNDPVSGACGDPNESSIVTPESPDIVTQASGPVTVGEDITDTATLSGGFDPTGTITFTAYSDDTCETEVFSDTATVSGNGDYTSDPYTTEAAGTVYWIAAYSGDANNDPASGSCGDEGESSVVQPASPGLATTPRLLPNDSATLSGGFGTLTGTLTFELFASADCSGDPIYEEGPMAVSGFGPYSTSNTTVFITGDGTYSWEVTYSGDGNNNGAFSSCEAEQQVIDFTPLVEAGQVVGP